MTIQQIAAAVMEKYPKYSPDTDCTPEPVKQVHKNEAYEDDANVHIHFNNEWMCIGYDQSHAPQAYLDRATKYAQKLIADIKQCSQKKCGRAIIEKKDIDAYEESTMCASCSEKLDYPA